MSLKNQNSKFPYALPALIVVFLGIIFYFLTANVNHIVEVFDKINIILRPIYYGVILSFLLVPVHGFFNRTLENKVFHKKDFKKKKSLCNGLSVFFSIMTAFFCVYLLLAMLMPQIYLSVENLLQSFPDEIVLSTPVWLEKFLTEDSPLSADVIVYLESGLNSLSNWLKTELMPKLTSIEGMFNWAQSTLLPNISGLVSGVSQWLLALFILIKDIVIAVIVSIYLLANKDTFLAQFKKLTFAIFPKTWATFILEEINNAYKILNGFINGKLLDSFIVGVICLIACNILGFPYTPLIATIIGITNIIPYFGPFIGAIPCALLILTVSPVKFLYFIVFILILQQFDGNILGPKILGESTGLASFWVLFSVTLFGGLFGFAGMVLGVPVFATLYSMVSRLSKHLLSKKDMPQETVAYRVGIEKKD